MLDYTISAMQDSAYITEHKSSYEHNVTYAVEHSNTHAAK